MPRAVWTGSIGFGLVSIPVRLYPATSPKDPRFHLIDRSTGQRVRNRRVVREAQPLEASGVGDGDPEGSTERTVGGDDIVRGYEVEPGRHVIVEEEELEELRPEPNRTIEIEQFVALEEIDPVHFEKSYHLAPADEIATRPYHLLRLAMEEEGATAVGRFVLRTREHLVAIRPTMGVLGLETLSYADEIREPPTRWTEEPEPADRELQLARRLIAQLREPWDPSRFSDPYRESVLKLIEAREARDEVRDEPEEPDRGVPLPDLMEALKASVDQLASERTGKAPRGKGSKRRTVG